MKRYVLDSYAFIAYAEGEKGAQEVSGIFKDCLAGKAEIFVCIVNWGEMYYIALREGGKEKAEIYINTLERYPINVIDADKEITIQAAQYKAFHKISYADTFAASLAYIKKAVLITGDKEFKTLENEIKINWI
jgi:ribonuclease VapC